MCSIVYVGLYMLLYTRWTCSQSHSSPACGRLISLGQVLGEENKGAAKPHGYGTMMSKGPFTMTGYFINGKAFGNSAPSDAFGFVEPNGTESCSAGPGVFRAPNGDTFYGTWNKSNKRHGEGLSVREGKEQIEM